MFRLSYSQGVQLEAIALAIRPDWAPSNPGEMLHEANMHGFVNAADLGHMIRALAVYATMPDGNGKPFGRGLDGYIKTGRHWTATAPDDFEKPKPPRCRTHPDFHEPCQCCAADAKAEKQPDPYEAAQEAPSSMKETP